MSTFRLSWLSVGAFPLAVVGMVIIMILPLPPMVLDFLVMLNISLAVLLIVAVVYSEQAEHLTALPSILLLSTLYRLGVNVSTTRQLLAEGEAPATIAAFGNFVVHGNIVVGAVVFAIITLVQFLVIAKGSERVAEVAARFALDAMPGKQMAIDADIRSGILSLSEAKKRREALQRESKLYGSLDGAMKFVKGDAIAALCITIVNVVGGLFVGMHQHGLSLANALETFTLFAIGDGLASQIPALLVAVAAGVAVTRVSGEDGMQLGDDVFEQLTSEPKAVISAAAVVLLIGCIPGLPGIPFWLMSAILFLVAAQRRQRDSAQDSAKKDEVFRPVVVPGLLLHLSQSATVELQKSGALARKAQQLRGRLFEAIGIYIHDIQFEIMPQWEGIRVQLKYQGEIVIAIDTGSNSVEGSLEDWILTSIQQFIDQRKAELIDDTQVRLLFEVHRASCEDLINSLVPSKLSVTEVTAVLRALVEEQVSVRNFARILQALAECEFLSSSSKILIPSSRPDSALHRRLQFVRRALARQISRIAVEFGNGTVLVVDAELDAMLMELSQTGLGIDPRIEEQLQQIVTEFVAERERVVIVSSPEVRRDLYEVLHPLQGRLLVVSAEEIGAYEGFSVAGNLSLDGVQLVETSGGDDANQQMLVEQDFVSSAVA